VPVGVQLVDQDRALLATVSGEIALAVTVDVAAADPTAPVDRLLPHAGVHRLPPPGHVAW
jgi:hypothetical protein